MLELTKEQKRVASAITNFVFKNDRQFIAISGYAGTGKTTVMGYAAAHIISVRPNIRIAYCAPTGKAASVLEGKLLQFGALNDKSSVNTIHGHIYKLVDKTAGRLSWKLKSNELPYDLFVVDEASMVTDRIFHDLLSLCAPLIFIGDPGQLPPVNEKPFKPLVKTAYRLETVHRQALENPIIAVATAVRLGEAVPFGHKGDSFLKIHKKNPDTPGVVQMFVDKLQENNTMVLCGINKTRISLNKSLRSKLGYSGKVPQAGEHLLCLRNDKQLRLYNGQIFTVRESYGYCDKKCCYSVRLDNGEKVVAYSGALNTESRDISRKMAMDAEDLYDVMEGNPFQEEPALFDYGYACSVHKAQGSEWDNVLLYDERTAYMNDTEYAQWLYTGVTRAKNKLCIVA